MQVMNDIYGQSSTEPFAVYDPDSSLWRTSQLSFEHPNGEPYLGTWPKQGTMRDGECYEHRTLERHIDESACSWLLATPDSMPDAPNKGSNTKRSPAGLGNQIKSLLPTPQARDHKGKTGSHQIDLLTAVDLIGESTSQPSDDGNASRDQHQDQPTNEEGLILDLWSG